MSKNKIKTALDAFHALSQDEKKEFFSLVSYRQHEESFENECVIYLKKRQKMDKIVLNTIAVVICEDRKMKLIDLGNAVSGIYSTNISHIKTKILETEMADSFFFHRTFLMSLRIFQHVPSPLLTTLKTGEVLLSFGVYVSSAKAREIRDFVLESRQ